MLSEFVNLFFTCLLLSTNIHINFIFARTLLHILALTNSKNGHKLYNLSNLQSSIVIEIFKPRKVSDKPLVQSAHMVQNYTCWDAPGVGTVHLQKQNNSYQSTLTCLCFGSPTVQLGPNMCDFVPCKRIVLYY